LASKITEYKTALPVSVGEYHTGLIYAGITMTKGETGGGEGVEMVINEPREEVIPGEATGSILKTHYNQYILHLQSKLPSIIRKIAPSGSVQLHVKRWDAYPYVMTRVSNDYMKDQFYVYIETRYQEGACADDGPSILSAPEKIKRVRDPIDFVTDPVDPRDYTEATDPKKFKSTKTGRGPLTGGWQTSQQHLLCEYSLVRLEFKWRGLQPIIETLILKMIRRLFLVFDREAWSSIDKWFGMSLSDIRELENKTQMTLHELRAGGKPKGMFET